MRRKNPHPKRAVNARTVLNVSILDARAEEEEEEEEQPPVLCLKIPVEDEVVFEINEQKEIRKEMTTTKGVKRKKTQQHECDVCEKMFVSPSLLAVHMRIHTKEKPYECDVCDKAFRQSGGLQSHMRIHTNEKPYECDVCEKRFRHSNALKDHMRIHTNEKPYKCDVCDEAFRQAAHLQNHMRIHTNETPLLTLITRHQFLTKTTILHFTSLQGT